MGKYFSDKEIELFLKKSLERNPNSIEMYINTFTRRADEVFDDIKILTSQRTSILYYMDFFQSRRKDFGYVNAHKYFIDDLESYFRKIYIK